MCKRRTQSLHHPSRSPVGKSERDSSCLANASLGTSFLFEARAKATTSPPCTGARPWTCPTRRPTTPRTRRGRGVKETRSRRKRNRWEKMACTQPLPLAPPSPPPARPSPWASSPSSEAAGGEWGTAEPRRFHSPPDATAGGSRVFLGM